MIRRLEIPPTAIGGISFAEQTSGVFVLAQAVDARLYAAPLGSECEPVTEMVWVDCGQVGWEFDPDRPEATLQERLAAAVQRAWAESWADS